MFCNGPEMDGGDTARLGPTTIIEMTIPRCQSSLSLDDSGGLAGPISCPPIHGVVHTLDGRRNMMSFVCFRMDAHTLVGCDQILRMYICVLPSSLFFFFFDAWDSVLH